MNIEELIYQIEKKPGMYADSIDLKLIKHFISGFMCNCLVSNSADAVDVEFYDKFHCWVKNRLEKNFEIKFDTERDYYFYITQVYQKDEELQAFFKLCHEFFEEMHCGFN